MLFKRLSHRTVMGEPEITMCWSTIVLIQFGKYPWVYIPHFVKTPVVPRQASLQCKSVR